MLISIVLVAIGVALSFFPDRTVGLSDRIAVFVPGNVHMGSAVAWVATHPSVGLLCLAAGLFIIVRRMQR